MLTKDDVAWIKENRAEILESRTEPVVVEIESQTGTDPYTGEPIVETTKETVYVVWKPIVSVAENERSVVGGIELLKGDVRVSFPLNVDIANVNNIVRAGVPYRIIADDALGLGEPNRQEALVRRVT